MKKIINGHGYLMVAIPSRRNRKISEKKYIQLESEHAQVVNT